MAAGWGDRTPCLSRQVALLWKALATNNQLARKVITLLYVKLKLRPPQLLIKLSEQVELVSVRVSSPHLPVAAPTLCNRRVIHGPCGMSGSPGRGSHHE